MWIWSLVVDEVVIHTKPMCGDAMSGFFFFQAEDGIRYLVRSRGLGDVYKRQLREYLKTKIPEDEFRDHRLEQLIDRPDKEFQDQDLSLIHI